MSGGRIRVELQFNTGIQCLMIPAIAGGGFHIRLEVRVCDAHHCQGQRIAGAAGHRLKEKGKILILPFLPCGEAVAILILRCGIVHLVGLGFAIQKQEKSNGIQLAGKKIWAAFRRDDLLLNGDSGFHAGSVGQLI